MSLTEAIRTLREEMDKAGIVQEKGLGTELFHFASTLAPVVNVDLLLLDAQGRVLLSWRDDRHDQRGWHIPGSCIRFRETLEESIRRCAMGEVGVPVTHSAEPIRVYEFHWRTPREGLPDQRERAHFITLVYACRLPADFDVNGQDRQPGMPGYLQWFDELPADIVPIQERYRQDWALLMKKVNTIDKIESNNGGEY